MGILKQKGIHKYIVISVAVILCTAVFSVIVTAGQYRHYEKGVRAAISGLLGAVREEYPNVNEEELIALLNREKTDATGEEILYRYGITEDVSVLAFVDAEKTKLYAITGGCVAGMGVLLLVLFFVFLRGREQRVGELTDYMKKVSRKEYDLALTENSEDALSNLQNELYKVTVMLKEAAEHDKSQREAIQESVSDISHQLKTPMTSIQILLDNLMENQDMEDAVRLRFLEEISRQTEGMSWLIGALLKLSRLEADVVTFAHEQICIADMVEEIRQKLAVLAEVKEVELVFYGNPKTYIKGDYRWNMEALLNIVKNAIEHSHEKSQVTVSIEDNDVYTKIAVSDCGEGIAPEELRHIFERFYRAKNATKDSVGIGLAMAKTIIEKQGGYIMADSKVGEGTTFTIKYMKL